MSITRKQMKAGARALRAKPGWEPTPRSAVDAAEELDRVGELARADQLEEAAHTCPECQTRRQALGDDTAFCDEHMRQILGF